MKQTPYSRILLIISGLLLGIAAICTYIAAIRLFPVFSFIFQTDTTLSFRETIKPLIVPSLMLTCSVLLLGHLYELFSLRSTVLVILCALLLPIGYYLSNETDAESIRYLFPATVFGLYPLTCLIFLKDSPLRWKSTRSARILEIVLAIGNGSFCAFLLLLSLTDQILFLQLWMLLLTPILPITFAMQMAFGSKAKRGAAMKAVCLLLLLLLPLSALLHPFSFDLSLLTVRAGLPILLFVLLTLLIVRIYHTQISKRKE